MAGGWLPVPGLNAGWQIAAEKYPVGDARTWSTTVPRDLTGYTAQWRFGIPDRGGQPSLLPLPYSQPQIIIYKASDTNLAINPIGNGLWALSWATSTSDTIDLEPGTYWQQAIVISPQGFAVTVDQGPVVLTPSLLPLSPSVNPMPLSGVGEPNPMSGPAGDLYLDAGTGDLYSKGG